MSAAEKLKRRVPREIEIDGDKIMIRSMTLREAIRAEELAKNDDGEIGKYVISRCVVEPDGTQAFIDDDPAVLDIPADKLRILVAEITKLTNPSKPKAIEKNSEATGESAS